MHLTCNANILYQQELFHILHSVVEVGIEDESEPKKFL